MEKIMRLRSYIFIFIISLFSPKPAQADLTGSFVFMPAYLYKDHFEKTPDSNDSLVEKNLVITTAYRMSLGLSFGLTILRNEEVSLNNTKLLTGQGLSIGYLGSNCLSLYYSYLIKPKLSYTYPALGARTVYYDGSGSTLDLGLHFGNSWLRWGPRILLINAHYKKEQSSSFSETNTNPLLGTPWLDRWITPMLGIWVVI